MAFKSLRTNDAPISPRDLPRLGDDAEVDAAAGRLRALADRVRLLDLQLEAILHHQHLDQHLATNDGPRLAMQRARLAVVEAEIAAAAPPLPKADDATLDPAIARGLELLKGAPLPADDDPNARAKRLRREKEIVDAAWRAASNAYDALVAEKSAEVVRAVQPAHEALILAQFRAAQALAAATDAEADFRREVQAAGYQAPEHLLRRPVFAAATMLGSETHWDSAISTLRRTLEAWKIL